MHNQTGGLIYAKSLFSFFQNCYSAVEAVYTANSKTQQNIKFWTLFQKAPNL